MADDIAQRITALTELTKGSPEDIFPVVDDPDGVGKKTRKLGFGTFLSTYNRTAGEIAASLSNDDLDFKDDPGVVRRYGTVGDGVADDTTAIQNGLNTGLDIVFPDDKYAITASLSVGTQRLLGLGDTGSFRQTDILPNGDFPAFIRKAGVFVTFDIDGFFIDYGPTTPTVAAGNDNKLGFSFTGAQHPQYSRITNCSIRGAWVGFFDDSGSFEFLLERVRTVSCRTGFFKENGTTIHFDSCGGGGVNEAGKKGQQEFVIKNCIAPKLTNCSADFLDITASTPDQTGNFFSQCPGLTIDGFDGESNSVAGDGSSFMKFDLTIGRVSGFAGITNTLAGSGTNQLNFFHLVNNSRIEFSGVRVPALVAGDLVFTGTGDPFTLFADNSSIATLVSSAFNAATGGSPTTLHSVGADAGGSIILINTFIDELFTRTSRVFNNDPITFTSTDATPSVAGGEGFITAGTTAITDFDDGVVGQTIKVSAASSITITDGAPVELLGSANFAMVSGDTLTLHMFVDQIWREIARTYTTATSAYTRNATIVEDRTLLASASATILNNNNVLAALIADLQAKNIIQ